VATKELTIVLEFDDKGTPNIKRSINEVSQATTQGAQAASKYSQGFNKLEKEVTKADSKFKTFVKTLGSQVVSIMAGMGAVMGLQAAMMKLKQSFTMAMQAGEQFSKQWAATSTMIMGGAEQIAEMKEELLSLSPVLGVSTNLAGGLYQVLSAAIPPEAAINFLAVSAKTAKAGVTDTFTAVDALTTVINAYGMKAAEVSKVSDIMFQTVFRGKLTYEQLASSIGTVATLAAKAGIDFEDLSGAVATMTRVGISAQKAMTSLRSIITTIIDPTAGARNMARQLGIELSATAVKQKGFVRWLNETIAATGGSIEKQEALFGNIRALTGILALAGPQAKEFAKDVELMRNSAGSTEKAFKKVALETGNLMEALRGVKERGRIGFFEGLMEGFFKGIKAQEDYEKKFAELSTNVYTTVKKIGQAINDFVMGIVKVGKAIWEHREIIIKVAEAYAIWFLWQKRIIAVNMVNWIAGAINSLKMLGLSMLAAKTRGGSMFSVLRMGFGSLSTPIKGLGGMLKNLGPIAIAAFAGWNIGKWIGEITGLNEKIQDLIVGLIKVKSVGVEGPAHAQLAPLQTAIMARAKELTNKPIKNQIEAMRLLQKEFEKTGTLGSEVLDSWAKGLGWVKQAKTEVKDLTGLAAAEAEVAAMSSDDLRAKLKEFGYSLRGDVEERFVLLGEAMKRLKGEIPEREMKRLQNEYKDMGIALGIISQGFTEFGVLTQREVASRIKELSGYLRELDSAFKKGTISEEQYKKGLTAITDEVKELDPALQVSASGLYKLATSTLPAATSNFKMLAQAIPQVTEGLQLDYTEDIFDQKAATLGIKTIKKLQNELTNLESAYTSLKETEQLTHDNEIRAVENIVALYKALGLEIPPAYKKILDSISDVGKKTGQGIVSAFHTLAGALGVLSDSVSGALQDLVRVGATVVDQLAETFAEQMKAGGKLDFSAAFKKLGAQLAGQLGAALGGVLGGGGGRGNYGGIGSAIGGVIGSIIPGVGNVIGSLVGGLFGGLFKKKKSPEQKAAEELARAVASIQKQYKYLGDISETTAKKIAELTKEYNRQTAQLLSLTDIMNDTGISSKNVSVYIQMMRTGLQDMAKGTVDAQKGITALGEAFSGLIEWTQKFGKEGSKEIVSFIKYVRQLGVSVAEVDDYVFSQLSKGAEGVAAMVSAAGGQAYTQLLDYKDQVEKLGEEVKNLSTSKLSTREDQANYAQKKAQLEELSKKYSELKETLATDLAPELERISNLTVISFNSLLAQGKSMNEAFSIMGDSLATLGDKYKELGISGGAAIQELLKLSEVSKANEGLFDAIEGNKSLLEALGNTGFLTADALKDIASQSQAYFNQLTDAGLTSKQALASIAPQLADLAYYAGQYGLNLDEATKQLIEQAKAEGVYKEKSKDLVTTLQEGFTSVTKKIDELIDKMTKELPKSFGSVPFTPGEETIPAQHGFEGTVTGPKLFYIEPGVRENVSITKKGSKEMQTSPQTVSVEKKVVFEPVVIPFKELQAFVIEWVQKAGADERILFRPRAIR